MNKEENKIKQNKSRKEDDNKEKDLPYDPNINSEDKQALHDKNFSMNQGQDKPLAERERPVDFAGEDLDIPGRDQSDTTHEGTDLPDEENLQFNERGTRPDEKKKEEHPDSDKETP